jgi:hypothetical protein
MARGDHYQHMAGECVRFAREATDAHRKALYLEMAHMWLRLAEQARSSEVIEPPKDRATGQGDVAGTNLQNDS